MPIKILIVDDEPDLEPLIRQRFRTKVDQGAFDFQFARNGFEALEKLSADDAIDLVMTDINMPSMDGLTLLKKIGELNRLIKTVMVSAYDDLQNIRTAMNRGAYDFLTKPINFQDFEATVEKTIQELAVLKRAVQDREELISMRSELKVANRIQQSILPRRAPPFPDFEVYAEMIPASELGGDFYDYFLLDERRLGFVIGDVSGKGVPAAIYMAMARTLLRATALSGCPPGVCVRRVNELLARESGEDMYVTLFYGILDGGTGEVEYCVAGQTPPYVLSRTAPRQLDTRGMMAGLIADATFGEAKIQLQPGETLFLYTDGLTDAEDAHANYFSNEGLRRAIENLGDLDAKQTVTAALQAIKDYCADAPPTDDVTVMAVRFLGE